MKAYITEFFDGTKLTRIECVSSTGEHIFDALWDANEPNTPENRIAFRDWTISMLKRKGYSIE
jgi:hypothetical protein